RTPRARRSTLTSVRASVESVTFMILRPGKRVEGLARLPPPTCARILPCASPHHKLAREAGLAGDARPAAAGEIPPPPPFSSRKYARSHAPISGTAAALSLRTQRWRCERTETKRTKERSHEQHPEPQQPPQRPRAPRRPRRGRGPRQ